MCNISCNGQLRGASSLSDSEIFVRCVRVFRFDSYAIFVHNTYNGFWPVSFPALGRWVCRMETAIAPIGPGMHYYISPLPTNSTIFLPVTVTPRNLTKRWSISSAVSPPCSKVYITLLLNLISLLATYPFYFCSCSFSYSALVFALIIMIIFLPLLFVFLLFSIPILHFLLLLLLIVFIFNLLHHFLLVLAVHFLFFLLFFFFFLVSL